MVGREVVKIENIPLGKKYILDIMTEM